MIDKPVAYARPAQDAVDALGAPPFERVASGMHEPGSDSIADLLTLVGAQQVLPDDVAIVIEGRHVGVDDRGVDRSAAARSPLVPARQIALQVVQRRDGLVVDAHRYVTFRGRNVGHVGTRSAYTRHWTQLDRWSSDPLNRPGNAGGS